jgi:hypothetical protein
VCGDGTPLDCDDSHPATTDSCDPLAGCRHDVLAAGRKLALNQSPVRIKMKVTSQGLISLKVPPSNGTASDPVIHGGSVRLMTAGGVDREYVLPPSNWEYAGPVGANFGYRYRDFGAVNGPIKKVAVKSESSASVAGVLPAGELSLANDPDPVTVILTLGSTRYCMRFGGTIKYVPGKRYTANAAQAPSTCTP